MVVASNLQGISTKTNFGKWCLSKYLGISSKNQFRKLVFATNLPGISTKTIVWGSELIDLLAPIAQISIFEELPSWFAEWLCEGVLIIYT